MFGTHIIIIEKGKGGQHYICMHGTNENKDFWVEKRKLLFYKVVWIYFLRLCYAINFVSSMNLGM